MDCQTTDHREQLAPLDHHARLVRDGNALGRSDLLAKLFDYLLERSAAGAPPKEIEIAVAVFGKSPDFDMAQDAAVRVYVHRLRRRLEEFYAGPARGEARHLAIPKGEYRLVLVAPATPDEAPVPPALPEPEPAVAPGPPVSPPIALGVGGRPRWLAAIAAVLALNVAAWAWHAGSRAPTDGFGEVRARAPWAALLQDSRPLVLVLGDYYIFGEIDDARGVNRLVREYDINSREELAERVLHDGRAQGRYQDLHLSYLPVSTAAVLRQVLPVLARTRQERDRIRVTTASGLTPDLLKQANIVYVGYLSGLGALREPVLGGSRLQVGATYDELVDEVSGRRFVGHDGGPGPGDGKTLDYGYFSTFLGPNGNRIVILAGMRDIGTMHTAEALANEGAIDALLAQAQGKDAFEALYEVDGMQQLNLGGKLVMVAPLKTGNIWGSQNP